MEIRCRWLGATALAANGKTSVDSQIRTANLASPGGRDGMYEVPAVAWFAA